MVPCLIAHNENEWWAGTRHGNPGQFPGGSRQARQGPTVPTPLVSNVSRPPSIRLRQRLIWKPSSSSMICGSTRSKANDDTFPYTKSCYLEALVGQRCVCKTVPELNLALLALLAALLLGIVMARHCRIGGYEEGKDLLQEVPSTDNPSTIWRPS
ncbi:hypothetical protein CONLIGDRAFT_627061 [Coniochaeta ligniaria NRRL 30616]|uniref:Uncharacterized protein n=1 Tax=Coniochaeta ligniaria NRRL 30616 TaxID=1408157 RepID=A0A1J7JNP3_9PEZI|nr:hypothetical protein CONLIGDRAFT_627061 [Coniochaeta ligniaria NRRL 30616]